MLRFQQVSRACRPLIVACGLAPTALALLPAAAARAEVHWHADLASAKAAAVASDRPVLAVLTAGWTGAAAGESLSVIGRPEAEALVSACFEPVRIDVDAQPALTKQLGVTHIPSICIIAADDTILSRFEVPGTTPEFVATAAKAVQAAAAHRTAVAEQSELRIRVSPAAVSVGGNAFATRSTPSHTAAAGTDATAVGSISLVTAKVRELSDFANEQPPTAERTFAPVAPQAVAVAHPETRFQPATSTVEGGASLPPSPAPAFARSAADWPAETAASPLTQPEPADPLQPALPIRPAVEPAATALAQAAPPPATPVTPWLGAAPPAAQAAVPAPATPPASDAAAPAEAPKSFSTQFLAAMQKPFSIWQKPPDVPKPSLGMTPSPPVTMPPARPLAPGAVPAASTTAAATAPPAAEATESFGSMPLGLEGYCPVTLTEKGQWTEGRAQWGARHRGRTYLFAGEEQQKAFLADPDRYAPALSGDDPVLACDKGTSAPGQRRYGVTYQSRMYLFSSPETRSQFAANPNRYVGRVALAETPARFSGTILR